MMYRQSNDSLLAMLSQYANTNTIPLHMPGHKRKENRAGYLKTLAAHLDITEIPGFDDLHDAEGLLRDSMALAAQLWGSKRCFYSVNGSTGGILAAIRAAAGESAEVLVARNCHKSVYHAIELCRLTPRYLLPPQDAQFGICGSLSAQQVRQAIAKFPNAKVLILTSPTYEGAISDIAAICETAHQHGVAVIVDEAHGAHLGVMDGFEGGAIAAGADVVIHSLHKVLPSLTQTAAVHWQGSLVDEKELARQMALFQTSSPSYLLMASIDSCVRWIAAEHMTLAKQWQENLSAFHEAILPLQKLCVLGYGTPQQTKNGCFWALDPGKLVVNTFQTNWSGVELARRLREDYHIETEMAQPRYVVAMTSCCDTRQDLLRFAHALCELDQIAEKASAKPVLSTGEIPKSAYTLAQAQRANTKLLSLSEAEGCASAAYIWAYPPGIPLLVPGEVITVQTINTLKQLQKNGVHLCGLTGTNMDLIQAVDGANAL